LRFSTDERRSSLMTAVPEAEGPEGSEDPKGRRRWAAYRRANWMLSGAGITLTLAGVPANSPEVQAIRRALRAVNLAGGIENERKEERRVHPAGGPRFGKSAS
jgi:hypothetical protein